MSKINCQEKGDFDCSAYLGHGLQWPIYECIDFGSRSKASIGRPGDGHNTNYSKQHEINTPQVRDWGTLLREQVNAVSEQERNALVRGKTNSTFKTAVKEEVQSDDHYYENEYSSLVRWMDNEEIIVPPPSQFANKREEIQQISLVAEQNLIRGTLQFEQCQAKCQEYRNLGNGFASDSKGASTNLSREFHNVCISSHARPTPSLNEHVANEMALKVLETPRTPQEVMTPGGFQNFIEEQLVGFGEESEKQQKTKTVFRKRRLCRHFVKGFCIRGDACDFLHDQSVFCSDEQQVFLGGLPMHFTPEFLKSKLEEQGLTVLNKPRIMRGFTPKVCLGSVKEAEELISKRVIFIDKHRVDVRPYQDKVQLRKGLPSVVKRSVFLGGLPENTTGEMIVTDLGRLDVKVVDYPVVKDGYAPRVVLGSVEHAKMLTSLKRVMVNGTAVDVRPYINFRKRY